jgi:hypothetical protein
LNDAAPTTLADILIVFREVSTGIRGDDKAHHEVYALLPRIRFLKRRFARGYANARDLIELRAIAKASEAVCDGWGPLTWVSTWLMKCVECLAQPKLVAAG